MFNKSSLSFRRHPFRSSLLVVILLIILAIVFNSLLVRLYLLHWFEAQGAKVNVDDITLSLWNATFTLDNLETSQNNQSLNVERLELAWQWQPLLENHLIIDRVVVEGLTLDIDATDQSALVIGSLASTQPQNSQAAVTTEASTNTPWQITLHELGIDYDQVCVKLPESALQQMPKNYLGTSETGELCIDQTMNFKGLAKATLADKLALSMQGNLAWHDVQFQLNQNTFFSTDKFALNGLTYSEQTLKSSSLEFTNLLISEPQKEKALNAQLGQFKLVDLHLLFGEQKIAFEQLDATDFSFLKNNIQDSNALLNFSNFAIQQFQHDLKNTSMASFSLQELAFVQVDADGQTTWQQLLSSTKHISPPNYLTQLKDFRATGISMNDDELSNKSYLKFDQIKLSDLQQYLNLNEQGKTAYHTAFEGLFFENSALESSATKEPSSEESVSESSVSQRSDSSVQKRSADQSNETQEPTSSATSSPLIVEVSEFLLDGNSYVIFNDAHYRLKHPIVVSGMESRLSDFNTLNRPIDIYYHASINDTGDTELTGQIAINGSQLSTDLKLRVSDLDLVPFSPYSARFVGYRVERGQLNLNSNIKLKDQLMDSEFDFVLNKLDLEDTEEHEHHELNQDLGVPLPTALSLLKNSDDKIELNIPLEGPINELNTSIGDVISTISIKAIKTAVLYQYTPFGLLILADGIIDLGAGLTFEPLVFEPGSITLTNSHREQLATLAKLTQQKPNISLVLCGMVAQADLMQPDSKEPPAPLTEEQRDRLINLAKQRQSLVLSTLIGEFEVNKGQLLTCNPSAKNALKNVPEVQVTL